MFNSSQNSESRQASAYKSLWQSIQRLFTLEVDNAKMMITEKLTVLTARLAVCFVMFVVGTCTLIFASIAAADFLLESLAARWTYLILAGFYFLVMVILVSFRKRIFVNPIARFLSSVILDPPGSNDRTADDDSASESHNTLQN